MSPLTSKIPIAGRASFEEVKEIFSAHLEAHHLRRTPERYAILEEIYSRSDHFDAEALYIHMKNSNYRVSRATVYNTCCLLYTSYRYCRSTASNRA